MTGPTVQWGLGAALALVAFVAGRRVVLRLNAGRRPGRQVPSRRQVVDSSLHLAMAVGMAVLVLPGGQIARPVLAPAFAALGFVLLGDGVRALLAGGSEGRGRAGWAGHGGHRLHHAVMAGIMVLMVLGPHASSGGAGGGTGTMAGMSMGAAAQAGHGASVLPLAAFGYACVSALVFAWRAPGVLAPAGGHGADPLGRSCEIVMFVGTALMLLPVI
ncbi:MAG: DUF5134 domain-containing protein [Actinocrinis sp.]